MIFLESPADFKSLFEIVSCFCEYQGKIILLNRVPEKFQGDKWGPPSGKREKNEILVQAMSRELNEETGMKIKADNLTYLGTIYVRYPDCDFTFHQFKTILKYKPNIKLSRSEHKKFIWLTPREALKINLVSDEHAVIKLFYKI